MNLPSTPRCRRCGIGVLATDRFCSACGASFPTMKSTPPDSGGGPAAELSHDERVLTRLRDATLGDYEILGEIGRGGMSIVYLAHDLHLDRKVAVKVLLPGLRFWEGMDVRFKREARTAAHLDHPNIVVIHGVRETDDLLFLVMKYIEGPTLEAVLRRGGPVPLPVAQTLVGQIAGALQYAHDAGVIHRDVKPGNIMLDARGTAIVTDFGIAKAIERGDVTRTGAMVGTPAYMSPEQCLGRPTTAASDQYSLGVVAYELLTGRAPFGGSTLEIQWGHARRRPAPIRTIRPECPVQLADAVMRMLAKDPAERWPSVAAAIPAMSDGPREGDPAVREHLLEIVRSTARSAIALVSTPVSPVPHHGPAAVPALAPGDTLVQRTIAFGARRLVAGESLDLAATSGDATLVTDATTLSWQTSDPEIATVSPSGELTAVAPGHAVIVVSDAEARERARWQVAVLSVAPQIALPELLVPEFEADPEPARGHGTLLRVGAGAALAVLAVIAWPRDSRKTPAELSASGIREKTFVPRDSGTTRSVALGTAALPPAVDTPSAPAPVSVAGGASTTPPAPLLIDDPPVPIRRQPVRAPSTRAGSSSARRTTRVAEPAARVASGGDVDTAAARRATDSAAAEGVRVADSLATVIGALQFAPARPPAVSPIVTSEARRPPPARVESASLPSPAVVANAVRLQVTDFVLLLRIKDYPAVARVYPNAGVNVARRVEFLRFLSDFKPNAVLSGPATVRSIRDGGATIHFGVGFRWRSNVGASRERVGGFLAHAVRRGNEWRIDRVEAVSEFWK